MADKKILNTIQNFVKSNAMVIFFIALAIFVSVESKDSFAVIANDVSVRFFRNFLLILSLIFPIMAGVGLNFGIVLGAMSAQLALVFVMALGLYNSSSVYIWWIAGTILISLVFGYLLSLLFNKTKKKEMISGLLVGFFAQGIYMFILMVILGDIIKLSDPSLVAMEGSPIKTTIAMSPAMLSFIDSFITVKYYYVLIACFAVSILAVAYYIVRAMRRKTNVKMSVIISIAIEMILAVIFLYCMTNKRMVRTLKFINMPVLTCIICSLICLFIWWISQSKLGQDFKTVRNDIGIAAAVGINVDRTRTIAIILSTILAGLGQILFIQNLGAITTYQIHITIPTYTVAALLIGGATVNKANIKNAIIGNILFQTIYGCAPSATKFLMGNSQVGEYFREFLCYGVIAVAIVIYAIKEARINQKNAERG